MKIYLTRHSRTLWNEQKRLQGRKDSPLTKEGIDNAYALRDVLEHVQFDAVFSSPIKRALSTAQILFPNQEIICDDRIQEMNFGVCEGMYLDDIDDSLKQSYSLLWHYPELSQGLPEGETYDDIEKRVSSFLTSLKNSSYENVMIVTHGFCFTIIVCLMLGLKREDYTRINQNIVNGCSLTIIDETQGHYTIECYGKNDFLPYQSKDKFSR